jgi:hypothetical protein
VCRKSWLMSLGKRIVREKEEKEAEQVLADSGK